MIGAFCTDYEFLSNFSLHEVVYKGVTYPTSEHAYQAAKAMNSVERCWIQEAPSPAEAKQRGQDIVRRPDWDDVKEDIMFWILRYKFANPDLKELLLQTGNQILVEGNNWHDNYWGNCICERRATCKALEGKNRLGVILMLVRRTIRDSYI